MKRSRFTAAALSAGCVLLATLGGAVASCSRTADPVPLRTFERAQKIDTVCLQVLDDAGNAVRPPVPAPQSKCTNVAPGFDGAALPYHLFALVTQTARGEVAVVDLTAGRIVDVDHSTPGIQFLPVGVLPSDVVSSPDGRISFIATAEPNKWAIYALPSAPPASAPRESRGILGDEFGLAIPKITDWPVCALPQAPSAMAILPRGTDDSAGYDLAVVLPGSGRSATKIAVIDPAPFLAGAGLENTPGRIDPGSLVPCKYVTAVELTGDVPTALPLGPAWKDGVAYIDGGAPPLPLPPGSTCTDPDAGAPVDSGTPTDAGSEAGTDAAVLEVTIPRLPSDIPRAVNVVRDGSFLYLADEGLPLIHVLDFSNPRVPRELAPLVATSVGNQSRRVSVGQLAVSPATRDFKRYLYAVDRHEGSLMVFDVTDVATGQNPRVPMRRPHPELNPFQAIDRITFGAPVTSVAFVRHDWPQFRDNGNPIPAPRTGLLCNPNINANADPDPARSVEQPFRDPGAYYRHNTPAGGGVDTGLGPLRLRGVFGFVTLASGQMTVIDVDDWDAPCRRPDPMGVVTRTESRALPGEDAGTEIVEVETDQTGDPNPIGTPVFSAPGIGNRKRSLGISDLAPLMPAATSRDDLDPYRAPVAFYTVAGGSFTTGVSNEAFFPVSAPHRSRSLYMLRRDATTGVHIPHLPSFPQLRSKGSAINTVGPNALRNPVMLPVFSRLPDPGQVKTPTEPNPRTRELNKEQALLDTAHLPLESSTANVRFAWEDPEVHVDQDWTIAYEGALPGFDGISALINPAPPTTSGGALDYSIMSLEVPNGLFCQRGVMDQRVASTRASQVLSAFASAVIDDRAPMLTPIPRFDHKLGDYVQIVDDILPVTDPYWSAAEPAGDSCWHEDFKTAESRHGLCSRTFGVSADESPRRDFPILEAYDDKLVIGRFGDANPANPSVEEREVVSRDPSNDPHLRLMRCCFHRQARFKVRASNEWVAVGNVSGFLHSMTRDVGGSCVPSCRPEDALMNGRAPQVPRPIGIDENEPRPAAFTPDEWRAQVALRREALKSLLERNSPLAMRNPMFAVVMWNEADTAAVRTGAPPVRGLEWAFSTRGQFTPLAINLGARTIAISPQTLRYIEPLRQLAVVDAANQGLQLFDLRTLAPVRDPYL